MCNIDNDLFKNVVITYNICVYCIELIDGYVLIFNHRVLDNVHFNMCQGDSYDDQT